MRQRFWNVHSNGHFDRLRWFERYRLQNGDLRVQRVVSMLSAPEVGRPGRYRKSLHSHCWSGSNSLPELLNICLREECVCLMSS
jgi:hypothetical protein